jgi:hypothetical protein
VKFAPSKFLGAQAAAAGLAPAPEARLKTMNKAAKPLRRATAMCPLCRLAAGEQHAPNRIRRSPQSTLRDASALSGAPGID